MTKIQVCLGILEKRDTDFRDNVNKWFEGTISTILTKKEQEKKEKNKVFYLKINYFRDKILIFIRNCCFCFDY